MLNATLQNTNKRRKADLNQNMASHAHAYAALQHDWDWALDYPSACAARFWQFYCVCFFFWAGVLVVIANNPVNFG